MNTIIKKPIITEKASKLSEKSNVYSFTVEKSANKIEIGKAVEKMFGVSVASVNTMRMPSKQKNKFTTKGVVKSRKDAYKKAMVTLAQGEKPINFYENV